MEPPALLLRMQGEGLEAALQTLLCAAPFRLSIMIRAARTRFFGSCMPCSPSPEHAVRPPTPWLPPEGSTAALGAQGWMGCAKTQIPLQGGECQKVTEKHQMACQVYLFTLFSCSPAAFDHDIFWANTFPLLTHPQALSAPS